MTSEIKHRCGHISTLSYQETAENIQALETTDCLDCFKANDPEGYQKMQAAMATYVIQHFALRGDPTCEQCHGKGCGLCNNTIFYQEEEAVETFRRDRDHDFTVQYAARFE